MLTWSLVLNCLFMLFMNTYMYIVNIIYITYWLIINIFQPGLPAYPVSPNISPISQRPESYRMMFQSIDSQVVF